MHSIILTRYHCGVKGCFATILLLLMIFLAVGCQNPDSNPVSIQITSPTKSVNPTLPTKVDIPTPSPTPTIMPTPSRTIEPSPTMLPTVTFGAPAVWSAAAQTAIDQLNQMGSDWHWQLANENNQADILFVEGDEGFLAGQRPLVLGVPFTTELEGISSPEALQIAADGHEQIAVFDWADLPSGYKALRIDGIPPDSHSYPLQQPWSLVAKPGFEAAALALGEIIQAIDNGDSIVHIAAVGDIMLDRALGYAIENGDLSYPFAHFAADILGADIAIGNLESALGDLGQPADKSYTFRAPPMAAQALSQAGFDIVSLANNHALDYGPEALMQGIGLLQSAGVATIGAGIDASAAHSPHLLEVDGLKIAVLGYVDVPIEYSGFDTEKWTADINKPGLAWANHDEISLDVRQAKETADLVVVVLHSGYEYVLEPSGEQVSAAHAAVDAGADLVLGHHAHVLQGIEFYNDGVIVYGLGNFAFEIDGDPQTALLNIWLDKDGIRHLEIVPGIIQFGGQPRYATNEEAINIRRGIYYLTNLLNSG